MFVFAENHKKKYVDKVRFCSLIDGDGVDAYQVAHEKRTRVRGGIPQDVV